MSSIKKQLGKRIKEIRKSKNITQEQLAEKVGIGTANISYIENGKFAPTIENFEKIADVLEVEPYELYMFSPQKSKETMRKELFSELEKNDKLLELIYKFYLVVK